MPTEIAKDESEANTALPLEAGREMIDYNRCYDCLAGSGNTRAKEPTFAILEPVLKLGTFQEPLASAWLSPLEEIMLLRCIVDRCNPLEDVLFFFAVLFVKDFIDPF